MTTQVAPKRTFKMTGIGRAIAHLRSASPYSQGKFYALAVPRGEEETHDDYEKRTWRERLHTLPNDGRVFIPANSFKNCLAEAAKYRAVQIPGKGKTTYTKHFEAGIMMNPGPNGEAIILPIQKEDVPGLWLHVPSDGRRGGTKRVPKCFPLINEWSGKVEFLILDPVITEEIFHYTLTEAGKFIGIGVSRPRNNGFFGRFTVERLEWTAIGV